MGNGKTFRADCNSNDFDRNVQQKLKKSIDMNKWCIIHGERSVKEANQFDSTCRQSCDDLGIKASPPAKF